MKKKTKGVKDNEVPWYHRKIYVYLLLIGLPTLVYLRVFTLGFTMLDDTIFISENQEFNKEISNIPVSFQRGLFNPTGDFYYRPVFLVDFILESKLFGTSPAGYHFTNLLFHIACVLLLYLFFRKLKIPDSSALVLSLIFAVHPVLSQAVAWIPGRNDMLLMIFFLTSLLLSMKFAETPRWYLLAGQFLALLLALFTKETAVIIPAIVVAVLAVNRGPWGVEEGGREKGEGGREKGEGGKEKGDGGREKGELKIENGKLKTGCTEKNHSFTQSLNHSFLSPSRVTRHASRVTMYGLLLLSWTLSLVIWFFVRSAATLKPQDFTLTDLLMNGISRSPALLQYLGKIFFPFNLAVFPSIDHITVWWGIAALALLVLFVAWSKSYVKPLTWIGAAWYMLFLVPVLVVPASLNDQVFEHRLYLPIVGILLVVSQISLSSRFQVPGSRFQVPGSKFKVQNFSSPGWGRLGGDYSRFNRVGIGAVVFVLLLFSGLTYARIGYFNDPVAFWTAAVEGNPTSAYARMMLGLRMTGPDEMKMHFEEAYRLNPDEKMLNYLIGKLALDANDTTKAGFHLKKELEHSDLPDNYFNLARVFFLTNNPDSATWCLENVIRLDPSHPQANHNLLLLYLQTDKTAAAKNQLNAMREKGLEIPPEAETRLKNIP